MTFKELKKQIKEDLKQRAQIISRGKYLRKPDNRINMTDDDKKNFYYSSRFDNWMVERHSIEYRHMHIAYCMMFNGTPYNMIEKPRENNKPSKSKLDGWKSIWELEIDGADVEESYPEESYAA